MLTNILVVYDSVQIAINVSVVEIVWWNSLICGIANRPEWIGSGHDKLVNIYRQKC